jgi:hypothetical protein
MHSSSTDSFSDELRSFSMTLHFYSPKAYDFVRNSFIKVLPHVSTIRRWCTAVEGKPGFTSEAFESLRVRFPQTPSNPILCSLVFDEMSIHTQIDFNGKENVGYVDFGTELDSVSLDPAKEVLLFLVVSLDKSWKMPIAYFLISGLTADVKSNLVMEAVRRLHEVNVRVVSIVCDGPTTNFAVGALLGASLTVENMRPVFKHPSRDDWNVHIVFDAAHMLKLMRNTIADMGILTDKNDKQIRWRYVKDLYELQEKEGLRAGNKLKRRHIEWYQQKMKVSLAAQTLSRSVANALDFVSIDLQLEKFSDVEATVKFIRIIDRLFDTLNSQNPFEKEFKSVMKICNETYCRSFLIEARDYLAGLKLYGIPLHKSPRKTAVVGFIATIDSVLAIYDEFVATRDLPYLATYRLSQDHIELTFNVVRSRGRWNNNPTPTQFRAAYRRLLIRHNIKPQNTGNAISQEDLQILPIVSFTERRDFCVGTENILTQCGSDETDTDNNLPNDDHNYVVTPSNLALSEFSRNIVVHIAGFVSRKLIKKLQCGGCKSLLINDSEVVQNFKLLLRKDSGGLVHPSQSVVTVCMAAERYLRFKCGYSGDTLPQQRNLLLTVQMAVLKSTQQMDLFSDSTATQHHCVVDILESRLLNLIRLIVKIYVDVRCYAMAKAYTEKLRGKNIRFNSNKKVLFAHQ